jgi:predicted nucleic acid-binding protein
MSVYIVDASVAAKWFFDEGRGTGDALRLLNDRHHLHAPDLFLLEFNNITLKRVRRNETTADQASEIRKAIRKFAVGLHGNVPLLEPAYEIALETGASIYDSLYVALAALMEAPVVTADRRLFHTLASGRFGKRVLMLEDLPA